MPKEITMPQLSDTMTEGTIVKWLKKEGDKISSGDIIAEIETDKATMEQEVFDSGTLASIVAKEGQKVAVGAPIAILATGSEKVEDIRKSSANASGSKPAASGEQTTSKTSVPGSATQKVEGGASATGSLTATDDAPGTPAPAHGKAAMVSPDQGDHRGGVTSVTPENGNGERIRVSPLARKIAADKGIDLNTLKGSGPGGRIVQKDLENAGSAAAPAAQPAVKAASPAAAGAALPARVGSGQKEVVPLTKMRATIAQRLQQSKQQIPHFYESVDVDAEALTTLREKLNKQLESQKIKLSVSDFVNKAIAVALLQHPTVNAHFNAAKNEYTRFGDVHLGIAVALPDGLIVPVLKNISQMGLKEIRQRSVDLADRARAGKLKGDEMTGATFTVSTLGQYGIKQFNAIINPPEVGILAVGAAEPRAVVRNGQVVARSTMTLTVSVDHRVVDGALAADFLKTLKGLLEEPGLMLV